MRDYSMSTTKFTLPAFLMLAGATMISMFLSSNLAVAQKAKIRAGTLTCKGKGGIGLILGSRERLTCTYQPSGKQPARKLAGTITRLGLDVGIKGKSVMVWAVFGSSTALRGEALGGRFAGVAADASLGLGAGAQVLVGGNAKSVTLQPLSVKGQTGINLAIGVSGLRLDPIK
jgi:Protein of unknown function (DUF992)